MQRQIIADIVVSELYTVASPKTGKELYIFKGIIVGCPDFPLLNGLSFNKFISQDVYKELSTLQQDRFDCSIGLSRTNTTGRDSKGNFHDIAFNLFINGFPKEEVPESTSGNVSQATLPSGQTVDDKSKKGGK